MNFLDLLNAVAKAVRPAYQEYTDVTDMDASLKDTGLDSMDVLMMCMMFCEIYGISEEVGKDLKPETARDFETFLEAHKTVPSPTSVKEAIKKVNW